VPLIRYLNTDVNIVKIQVGNQFESADPDLKDIFFGSRALMNTVVPRESGKRLKSSSSFIEPPATGHHRWSGAKRFSKDYNFLQYYKNLIGEKWYHSGKKDIRNEH
jgi:hypothetical protein